MPGTRCRGVSRVSLNTFRGIWWSPGHLANPASGVRTEPNPSPPSAPSAVQTQFTSWTALQAEIQRRFYACGDTAFDSVPEWGPNTPVVASAYLGVIVAFLHGCDTHSEVLILEVGGGMGKLASVLLQVRQGTVRVRRSCTVESVPFPV